MRRGKSLLRVAVTLAAVLTTTTAAVAQEPPDASSVWGEESDVVVQIAPDAAARPQADDYGWEPLGIVAGGTQIRRHSVGGDVWEVWLCDTGSTPFTYSANSLRNALNDNASPYYEWLSEGIYDISFVSGGTVTGSDIEVCLGKVFDQSGGSRNGAVVVLDNELQAAEGFAGLAGPGNLCYGGACGEVPDTFPGNERYALLGAETFSDDSSFGEALPMVAVHELGHAAHFPHSYSGETGSEYDNPLDVMSGNLDPDTGFTYPDPYGTLGFSRYAAGWIPSSDVVVYRGGVRNMKLAGTGSSGNQLVVIDLGEQGRYITIDARLRNQYDPIPASLEGAGVHEVDQRPNCFEAGDPNLTSCFGILRTHLQEPADPFGAGNFLQPGEVRTFGSYRVRVTSKASNSIQIELIGFDDIANSTFRSEILWLAEEGITTGCDDDSFCPNEGVTRGQMASFLVRALDLPKADKDYFDDDEGNTHEGNINRLAAAGITTGCGGDNFCPDDTVTRAQMASFLARAYDLPSASKNYFNDDNSSVHESNINRLAKSGITQGCNSANTMYCPNDAVTRGQMAAFLFRADDL